jgi:hypothetical protein
MKAFQKIQRKDAKAQRREREKLSLDEGDEGDLKKLGFASYPSPSSWLLPVINKVSLFLLASLRLCLDQLLFALSVSVC